MLIQSLLGMESRHVLVRDTYRNNMKRLREFTFFCKQRAKEISPDREPLLVNCFKLWDLLIDQRAIRFEYLLKSKSLDCSIFKSLDEIDERLDKAWDLTEEGLSFVWSSCSGNITPSVAIRLSRHIHVPSFDRLDATFSRVQ